MTTLQTTLEGEVILDSKHMRRGRASPWSTAQLAIIEAALPRWLEFSINENGSLEGRDLRLTNWKKTEAERILKLPEFETLPDGVSW
jgi:hypothetical protein